MTIPPKELSLDEAAEAYAQETDHKFEYAVSWEENMEIFKSGAAYQAGVDERRVAGMVDALETASHLLLDVMKNCVRLDGIGMRDFGKCITQIEKSLATYKSKGTT